MHFKHYEKYIKSVYFIFIFVKTQSQLEYIQMKNKIRNFFCFIQIAE